MKHQERLRNVACLRFYAFGRGCESPRLQTSRFRQACALRLGRPAFARLRRASAGQASESGLPASSDTSAGESLVREGCLAEARRAKADLLPFFVQSGVFHLHSSTLLAYADACLTTTAFTSSRASSSQTVIRLGTRHQRSPTASPGTTTAGPITPRNIALGGSSSRSISRMSASRSPSSATSNQAPAVRSRGATSSSGDFRY